jgi:hypothetical protein
MAQTRIKLNHAGMAQLLKSSGVAADIQRRAEQVAAAARASAPVDTGAYQAGIHVTMETHPSRVEAHVSSDVWYAGILEAKLGILGRALDAAR